MTPHPSSPLVDLVAAVFLQIPLDVAKERNFWIWMSTGKIGDRRGDDVP